MFSTNSCFSFLIQLRCGSDTSSHLSIVLGETLLERLYSSTTLPVLTEGLVSCSILACFNRWGIGPHQGKSGFAPPHPSLFLFFIFFILPQLEYIWFGTKTIIIRAHSRKV